MKTTPTDALPEVWQALGETVLMVGVASVCTVLIGTLVGVLFVLTGSGGLWRQPVINTVLGMVINIGRSLPFIILLIVVIPVTRLIAGTAIGPVAAIVPLTLGSVPFFARVVETALREVSRGKVEAAQGMGATRGDIVLKVLLPEAAPGLVAGITLTVVMLIGFSAMAGTIGGGGLGDFALRYGYQRFNTPVLLIAVVVLIVLVQGIQSLGDLLVRRLAHRRSTA
ncbi:MAG: ABC transporter permease [Propionibacteriales bacterium]|nr:ABC transporter permease [Propionibacteriales bacterium]